MIFQKITKKETSTLSIFKSTKYVVDPSLMIEAEQLKEVPAIKVGDTVKVHAKIVEGTKERIQVFQGVVLKMQHAGARQTFTVRKVTDGIGVERTWPLHSPSIAKIEVVKSAKVRRAKLNYLRDRFGKKARLKEIDQRNK